MRFIHLGQVVCDLRHSLSYVALLDEDDIMGLFEVTEH